MSYLLMNELDITNIIVSEHRDLYKIKYNYKLFTLMGIVLRLSKIEIINIGKIYYLIINDKKELDLLMKIDEYFTMRIPNYNTIITDMNNKKCIKLPNNLHIDNIYVKKSTNILLNIKYIKKNELNNPIIHIIDG